MLTLGLGHLTTIVATVALAVLRVVTLVLTQITAIGILVAHVNFLGLQPKTRFMAIVTDVE